MTSPRAVVAASLLAISSALLGACREVSAAPRKGTEPSQWRIVWTESPQTNATIAWTTAALGERHVVHFDTIARGGAEQSSAYRHSVTCDENGRYTGEPEAYFHHARLTKLEPDTPYWFVIESDGGFSPEFWFRTAPDGDVPVTFLHGGDSRSGRPARQGINALITRLATDDPDILCIGHGGDYVYHGTELGLWMKWMSDHEQIVTPDSRLLPIVPARGNHESVGPQFDEVFGFPGGGFGKNYYATKLTPEVLLVTLNTEVPHGGPQTEFLRNVAAEEAPTRWKLAQYHRPMFPAVKKPTRAKPHWQPVFDEARFDLVMESDGHTLRRTVPILGEERAEDGVTYIGEGGFGVKQRTPDRKRWYLQDPGFADSAHHVWKVTLTEHTVVCTAMGLGGKILHSFHLTARARAAAPAATRDSRQAQETR